MPYTPAQTSPPTSPHTHIQQPIPFPPSHSPAPQTPTPTPTLTPTTAPRPNPRQRHDAFIIGFDDGTIRPHAHTTRAHAATILFRLTPDEKRAKIWSQDNPFPDVEPRQWFNNAISTITNTGTFTGMPDGYFYPNRAITRAELVAAVVRFMGAMPNNSPAAFSDTAGHWATGYINTAAANGWVTGYGGQGSRFLPDQAITRAETAALINRIFNRLPKHYSDLPEDMIRWPDNADTNAWYYLYIQEATNSHYYVRMADNVHETWQELLAPRPWVLLERPYSRPWDIFVD